MPFARRLLRDLRLRRVAWGLAAGLAVACGGDDDAAAGDEPWAWELPPGIPEPKVPEDNPMSLAKVELGRRLFYDVRLSGNETQSCGSCHEQARAFTDGLARAVGSLGDTHTRGSMSLANAAYQSTLTWANPALRLLEAQALLPMFGDTPIVELGMGGREDELLARLRADADYPARFARSFPETPAGEDAVQVATVVRAIAAFQRSLLSFDSPFDRYERGDLAAMSEAAIRGRALFFSERFECFHCHGGFNFSASLDHQGQVFDETPFFNNGLYNLDGRGAYPPDNPGLAEFTDDPRDQGRFKPPTLRNIELTAPYMHDGSIATLEDVIEHYAAGGRRITEGEYAGDGRFSPNKNVFVPGFEATAEEKADLLAFLRALTDTTFVTDPRHADPLGPAQP